MEKSLQTQIMKSSRLFDGFLDDEIEIMRQTMKPELRSFNEEEIVISEKQTMNQIGILYTGKLLGMKFYYEGNAHLLCTFSKGETIGLETIASTMKTSPLTFIAAEKSQVLFLSLAEILQKNLKVEKEEKLSYNMLHILSDENIKMLYKTEILSKRALRERIMTYLRIIQERRGQDSFYIDMNREQFSQYLCVNRSALSYELNQMKREGIISFKKNFFTIH